MMLRKHENRADTAPLTPYVLALSHPHAPLLMNILSPSDRPAEVHVRQLVSQMTLREKLGQLTQCFSGRNHREVGVESYYASRA